MRGGQNVKPNRSRKFGWNLWKDSCWKLEMRNQVALMIMSFTLWADWDRSTFQLERKQGGRKLTEPNHFPSFQTEFFENGANNRPRSCRTGSKIDKLDTRIDALIRLGHFHFPGYAKCTRNVLRLCMLRFPISIQTPTCSEFRSSVSIIARTWNGNKTTSKRDLEEKDRRKHIVCCLTCVANKEDKKVKA